MTIIVLAGFLVARIFKVGQTEQKFLSKLLLYFINPCLVISSFNVEFDPQKIKQLGFVALVSLGLHAIMIAVVLIFYRVKNEETADYDHMDRVAVVFTNCGFIGIPLIRGVFGNEGVFFLMGYLVLFNIFLWTFGYYQMCGEINIKKIVTNPNIIAVTAGLILYCLPFNLPEFIAKPITMIGDLNTALAMILIGVLFADFQFDKKYLGRLIKCTLFRLVICAAINVLFVFAVYKLCIPFFDCKLLLIVALICSMCPSATSVPSLSCLFEMDTSYASLVVSISSLVCILTIPSFVALADFLLK